jgi:hypothetical protein
VRLFWRDTVYKGTHKALYHSVVQYKPGTICTAVAVNQIHPQEKKLLWRHISTRSKDPSYDVTLKD